MDLNHLMPFLQGDSLDCVVKDERKIFPGKRRTKWSLCGKPWKNNPIAVSEERGEVRFFIAG
jgi:hypothetical protein